MMTNESTEDKTSVVVSGQNEPVVMLPMPNGMKRVETGVVKFGDDWPSVHIRGDNAMHMTMLMRTAASALRVSIGDEISAKQLESYADLFRSCLVT